MNSIFSPDDFKKWMMKQSEFSIDIPRAQYLGSFVDVNIPMKKLASKICVREGNLEELVEDFSKRGGKVIDIDGKHLMVEVNSGSFSIPECCIRRR
jgi:hypothetical protein